MNIQDVLAQIGGKEVLSEESAKLLTDAFNEAVDIKVKEQVTLQVESAFEKFDTDCTEKVKQLLEAIDKNHTEKITKVVEKIDEDHCDKLNQIKNYYNTLLKEDAKSFKEKLVNQIDQYFDVYIEENITKKEISEAVQNKQAKILVEKIKQIVSLDEDYITNTIREGVEDAAKNIESLKSELNEAIKQNIQISQDLKNTKATLLIEKNTREFSKDKKDYVVKILKGKDFDFITENFDYAAKMFDKQKDDEIKIVAESAKKDSKVLSQKIDSPKSDKSSMVTESVNAVDGYLNALKRKSK